MENLGKTLLITISIVALQACSMLGGLPEGEEFNYEVGEIVYFKADHMPMLIEKQVYKKKQKKYDVVFKNKDGHLLYNTVPEEELLATPPSNRARI
ncbi:MAG: hypothetical protein K0U33_01525 [Bacteroidetes bacterium]|jgi:hypothetical protein|nr:hypothetical protein [Bacteroidota bacterium]MDA9938321.1 hypothetical protein [Salibacteraceae bacterium]MDA9967752.1 hypothetical protein [Salibacteraceae bacterium]|tara:strand:+ start:21493 stop:21780 length:288 start_codon:yes stop_codon:yes gene_type:complete